MAVYTEKPKSANGGLMQQLAGLGIGGALVAILGGIAQLFLPWWIIAVVAAIIGFFLGERPGKSYVYGFSGALILWSAYAYWLSAANAGILTGKMATLLGGILTGAQLIFFTGFIGGLVGGMGAMTGALLKEVFYPGLRQQPD